MGGEEVPLSNPTMSCLSVYLLSRYIRAAVVPSTKVVCTPRPDGFMATQARRITTDMTHIPRVCEPAQWSESHTTVLVKWRHHH